MLRLAANLTMLYNEWPFEQRFAAAAEDRFEGVEFLFPYQHKAETLARRLEDEGLVCVLHNLPPGDWDAGERGIACLPGREAEFRDGVRLALDYARTLGCRQLNCLAGLCPEGLAREEAMSVLRDNLAFALESCAGAGIRLNLEAINSRVDIPGYLLDTGEATIALIESINHPALTFQFDLYHMSIMGGALEERLARWKPLTGHLQFADDPGRHEPGTGSIDWPSVLETLKRLDYDGWMSAEYRPRTDTRGSLHWLASFRAALAAA